jgi:hypothetical protein
LVTLGLTCAALTFIFGQQAILWWWMVMALNMYAHVYSADSSPAAKVCVDHLPHQPQEVLLRDRCSWLEYETCLFIFFKFQFHALTASLLAPALIFMLTAIGLNDTEPGIGWY